MNETTKFVVKKDTRHPYANWYGYCDDELIPPCLAMGQPFGYDRPSEVVALIMDYIETNLDEAYTIEVQAVV